MKISSGGAAVSPLLLSIGLLMLVIVADSRPQVMSVPGSWDDYDDDLFDAAANRRDLVPGSWDDYDDDLFDAAANRRDLVPGSWDDYDDDLFDAAANRNVVLQPFMMPLQAPFLGRKPKQNVDLNGKRTGGSLNSGYRPRPIRPIIPKTYRGKIVMF